MEVCFCCGKNVTNRKEKKNRHPLSSPGVACVLETLTVLATNFLPGVDSSKLHTGYACRACTDRLLTLTSNLQSALPILPKLPGSTQADQSADQSADQTAQALHPSTPVPVQSSQVESPPVTVSHGGRGRLVSRASLPK